MSADLRVPAYLWTDPTAMAAPASSSAPASSAHAYSLPVLPRTVYRILGNSVELLEDARVFLTFAPADGGLEIQNVVVPPELRHRGLGHALLARVMAETPERKWLLSAPVLKFWNDIPGPPARAPGLARAQSPRADKSSAPALAGVAPESALPPRLGA